MKNKLATFSFCLCILILPACKQKGTVPSIDTATIQHQCVHRLTEVIVRDILTPPVAGRVYAYSNLAYYEAIRFKEKGSYSIAAAMKGFGHMPSPENGKEYNYTLTAVRSFFRVAKSLSFSKDSLAITEKKLLDAFQNTGMSQRIYQNSISLGDTIAGVIMERAAHDNYKKTRGMPRYSVFKEPGKWQQTPPDYADATEPNWRLIQPLLLDSAAQYKAVAPPPYNMQKGSPFYREVMEVYTVNKHLTPSQDTIAHYWDDNPFVTGHEGHFTFATKKTTPGGHWMGITAILTGQTKADDVKTARVYALTAAAIFDGFIVCWDEKFRSRKIRPITVIRENIDPNWNALLQTPPFPEYTSGHSVITSAAATVLTAQLGDNIAFHDTTELEYLGLQRSFPSILAAADETGISRLYGGIHFRSAIMEGRKQGQQVGGLYNSIFK